MLKFSTQGYYEWLRAQCSQRDYDDAHLVNVALDLHGDDPEFGYRLLTDELRSLGRRASENRVWRLCSMQATFSVYSRKRGLNRKPGPPVHDDLLERDSTAGAVNVTWLTDITEHPTSEGKLYLCAVKDCASNRIVGYSIDARMTSELAVTAVGNAVALLQRRRNGSELAIMTTSASSPRPTSRTWGHEVGAGAQRVERQIPRRAGDDRGLDASQRPQAALQHAPSEVIPSASSVALSEREPVRQGYLLSALIPHPAAD